MSNRIQILHRHRAALAEFETDYRNYVEAQIAAAYADGQPDEQYLTAMRRKLLQQVSRASRAMSAADLTIRITPPPMFGGYELRDLSSQIFAHENATYGSGPDPFLTARLVLDGLATGIGSLDDQIDRYEMEPEQLQPDVTQVQASKARIPTIWGHVKRIPRWVATTADFITVGGVFWAVLRWLGVL